MQAAAQKIRIETVFWILPDIATKQKAPADITAGIPLLSSEMSYIITGKARINMGSAQQKSAYINSRIYDTADFPVY